MSNRFANITDRRRVHRFSHICDSRAPRPRYGRQLLANIEKSVLDARVQGEEDLVPEC